MQGKYLMKDNVTSDANDERALGYDGGDVYFNDGGGWIELLSDANFQSAIPAGTKMWFYQVSAPTGWLIVAAIATDTVIGVKSTAGTYTTGGQIAGNWSNSHWHSAGTLTGGAHFHQWYHYAGSGVVYSWLGDGLTLNRWGDEYYGTTIGPQNRTNNAENQSVEPRDFYTSQSASTVAGVTGTYNDSAWRPYTNVVILATKN